MSNAPQFGERTEYGPNDVCYRHKNVPSMTLCQRCGRTICPECQTQSSVGVLCPNCVKEMQPGRASRATREARVAGRRIAQLDYPVTYAVIALCVVVYLGQLLTHYFGNEQVTTALWYAPVYSLSPETLSGTGLSFEPWRMVTVMFTHSPGFIFHILFNMYALWLFGRNLERILGHAQFAVLYLFSGIGGALASMLWVYIVPGSINQPTVGASGAIFGVMAATLVAYRAANVSVTSLVVMLAVNFGIGFLPGTNIAWQAHLGGMIVGAATAAVLVHLRGPRKRGVRIGTTIGVGAVLVLLGFAYFVASPIG